MNHNFRSKSGVSLVELLVVVLMMGFVSAAAVGMLTSTMSRQVKLQNKCDSLDSASKTMDRIGRIVRMGKRFGPGCSATTLVIVVPKFDDNGFPYNAEETHTFSIVPDGRPGYENEFRMFWTKDPGAAVPASADPSKALINTPIVNQQLLEGILAGSAFAYLNRTTPTVPVTNPFAAGNLDDYTGCTLNFEVLDHKNSARVNNQWRHPVTVAYKTEVFLRNNANLSN